MRKDSGLAIVGGLSAFAGLVFLMSGHSGSDISLYANYGIRGAHAEPAESDGAAIFLGLVALGIGAFFLKESGYFNRSND
ncbi:hypothetical protein FHR99_003229 [Litorivivens lipolytica]|uniref:Uncharacterized protein n=1 Tax=Litorivivens lipolytica TaxID=1524264 RepID=A0A7W4W7R1_9GAMM|nr:hypothetical protein [Litorivivens lipolytica]MBB3048955.1 hypothetical protein [Litorivivens lipolytica]